MGSRTEWLVRFGREEWERFTYERPEGDPLRLLGSVERGARAGALGIDEAGQYVQVNGDYVSQLSGGQLRRAVAAVEKLRSRSAMSVRKEPARVPVVVIKRRRLLLPGAPTAS
jgi:hypothetical protein